MADPLADRDPWLDAAIDWERTIAFRRHLWSLGLGVAEAMDTAQRGMGMDWPASLELIRRSLDANRHIGALRTVGEPVASLLEHRQRKCAAEGNDLAATLELGEEQHVVDQLAHLLDLLPRLGKQGVAVSAGKLGGVEQRQQPCQRRPQLVRDRRRETNSQLLVRAGVLHDSGRVWPKS